MIEAAMFTVVWLGTDVVVTVNIAVVAPAATLNVGLGRTRTWGLSVTSIAVTPPAGIAEEKFSVTVAVWPP